MDEFSQYLRHFEWMRADNELLLAKLDLLAARVRYCNTGMELVVAEFLEDEIADLILMLDVQLHGVDWLDVPIQRHYITDEFREAEAQVGFLDVGEADHRFMYGPGDRASKASVSVRSPSMCVAYFHTTAWWIREGVPCRRWGSMSTREQQEYVRALASQHDLYPPANLMRKDKMLDMLRQWISRAEITGGLLYAAPDWTPSCIATQLCEISIDVFNYINVLDDVERVVGKFTSKGRAQPAWLGYQDYCAWRACAIHLRCIRERLARHFDEMASALDQLDLDLRYYCQAETGPWMLRIRKLVSSLRRICPRIDVSSVDPMDSRTKCGFSPIEFDGTLSKNYEERWDPIHSELLLIADHLSAATMPPNHNAELPLALRADPTLQGKWIGPSSKENVARVLRQDDNARWRSVKKYWPSDTQIIEDGNDSLFRIDHLKVAMQNRLTAKIPPLDPSVDKPSQT